MWVKYYYNVSNFSKRRNMSIQFMWFSNGKSLKFPWHIIYYTQIEIYSNVHDALNCISLKLLNRKIVR